MIELLPPSTSSMDILILTLFNISYKTGFTHDASASSILDPGHITECNIKVGATQTTSYPTFSDSTESTYSFISNSN